MEFKNTMYEETKLTMDVASIGCQTLLKKLGKLVTTSLVISPSLSEAATDASRTTQRKAPGVA